MRRIIIVSVCALWLLAGCQQLSQIEWPEIEWPEIAWPEIAWPESLPDPPEIDIAGFNPIDSLVEYLNSTGIAEEVLPEEEEEFYEDYEFYYGEILYPDLPQNLKALEEASTVRLPQFYPLDIEGDMIVDSNYSTSSLIKRVYRRFTVEGYEDTVQVNEIGMEKAIRFYCRDHTIDITQIDRPMTSQELASCVTNGRLPAAFPIISDPIAVVVNANNDFLEDVSMEELAQIFRAERWSDVNEEWPDELIIRLLPELNSGITRRFAQVVLEQDASAIADLRNTTLYEDPLIIDQNIERNLYSIGFMSYAYYNNSPDFMNVLTIDGEPPLYLPLDEYESAEVNENYPLQVTQRLYADMNQLPVKENVQAFVNFAIAQTQAEGMQWGYNPLPTELWDQSKRRFVQATTQNNIVVAGSVAVAPWVDMGYQQFREEGYTTNLVLRRESSAAGISSFCEEDSNVDIAMTNRLIQADEADLCAENGREPFGIRIGSDMVAVVINRSNTFVKNVTLNQLGEIFTAERWSDVDEEWPDEPIQRFVPGTDSGTFSLFAGRVLRGDSEALEGAPNTTFDNDEDVLIDGIVGDVFSLGFMAYDDYAKRSNDLSLMAINSVRPDAAIEENKPYLLESPLNLYIDPADLQKNLQLTAFIAFQLRNSDTYLAELGYVSLNSRVQEDILSDFLGVYQANDIP